ncbi:hypothetical protein [Peribacillus sp. SCS-155]|uniref:hypothetical protein n=1 Tax=Peribacillus sedimenti TaxID=3115297 RepID=UPI003905D533
MKKTIAILTFAIWVSLASSIHIKALTLDKLPASQASQQWGVVIGRTSSNIPSQISLEAGVFNIYNIDIKNIGDKNIENVVVEVYRDGNIEKTKYELFTTEAGPLLEEGSSQYRNIPVSEKTHTLEVIITWTKNIKDKHLARRYKESFVFVNSQHRKDKNPITKVSPLTYTWKIAASNNIPLS